MARLSSEELTRRYGHLFPKGFVLGISWFIQRPVGTFAAACANCGASIIWKQHRVLICGRSSKAPSWSVQIHVCRDYAACERRRKEQAGGSNDG